MIAGVGVGTKHLGRFLECTKTYETVVLFGAATDTYDRVGKVVARAPYEHVTKAVVEQAMDKFRGKIEQLPPLYSALKMDGKPLYEYARSGKPIPRSIEKRWVEVQELELLEWLEPGTHNHVAPSQEASGDEKRVARGVWELADVAPGREKKDGLEGEKEEDGSGDRKRKASEELTGDETALEKKPRVDPAEIGEDELVCIPESARHAKSEEEVVTPVMSGAINTDSTSATASTSATVSAQPAARIRMTVTSGFYVRSFCHDLGAAVGSAALMAELVRTRQGDFELGRNVLPYGLLEQPESRWGPEVQDLLDDWNKVPRRGRPSDGDAPPAVAAAAGHGESSLEKNATESKESTEKDAATESRLSTEDTAKDNAEKP